VSNGLSCYRKNIYIKLVLFITISFAVNFASAQNTAGIKIIPADSLQKYHIRMAKADTSAIHLVKNTGKPLSQMNVLEKGIFLVKDIFKSSPIIAWSLMILLGLWLLNQMYKLFNRQKKS
jgi:hypothetical protein